MDKISFESRYKFIVSLGIMLLVSPFVIIYILAEAAHMAETSPQCYNDEKALRHVVIMAYLTSIDHYLRFEEIASGRGYSDILFLPGLGSGKPALLVELKWDKSADKAITQIMDKQYPTFLIS